MVERDLEKIRDRERKELRDSEKIGECTRKKKRFNKNKIKRPL